MRAEGTYPRRTAIGLALALVAVVVAGCGSTTSSPASRSTTTVPSSGGSIYDSNGSVYDSSDDSASADEIAQTDWENQEGDNWDQFNEGYLAGWEAGCDAAFEGSPDGYLYEEGDQFSADDCYALAPYDASDADVPYEVPYDPYSDGEALGETDGCNAAFEQVSYDGYLYYGEESFDASVCP